MPTKSTRPTSNPATRGAAGNPRSRKRVPKGARLIHLLKARSGRDIAALSADLGWQPHTTRAALSRLRKAGYAIEKLPPGEGGGTRYRITGTPTGPAR